MIPIGIMRKRGGGYLVYAESYDAKAKEVRLHVYTVASTPQLDEAFAAKDKLAILEALRHLPVQEELYVLPFPMGKGHTPRTFFDRTLDGASPGTYVVLW